MITKVSDLPRYTVILPQEHKDKLAIIAKRLRLSQGEIIEVMVDMIDSGAFDQAFKRKLETKLNLREKNRELRRNLTSKLESLTSEQLQKILEA